MGIEVTTSPSQFESTYPVQPKNDLVLSEYGPPPSHIGVHLLADFYGLSVAQTCDAELLSSCLLQAAHVCGLTPLSAPVVHIFDTGGLTAFLPLSESHIALHTYPEYGYLALDIFSCGESDPNLAIDVFRTALAPAHVKLKNVRRGDEFHREELIHGEPGR